MYDITRFSTLNNIKEWMDLIYKGLGEDTKIPIILVGGKIDLEDRRAIAPDIPNKIVQEYGFVSQILCSARSGYNVEEIFIELTKCMIKNTDFL